MGISSYLITSGKQHLSSFIVTRIQSKPLQKLVLLMAPGNGTKLGITFGQLYSLIILLIAIISLALTFNGKIVELNSRITALEEGRKTNAENIALIRGENNAAHMLLGGEIKENNKLLNQLVGAIDAKSTNTTNNTFKRR